MKPIIKWPGWKLGEIDQIKPLIPAYKRYVEPFFGGGALFFHLQPPNAAINDISESLITFYKMVQKQDEEFKNDVTVIINGFSNMLAAIDSEASKLVSIFLVCQTSSTERRCTCREIEFLLDRQWKKIYTPELKRVIPNKDAFYDTIKSYASDKFARTIKNFQKKPFSEQDLRECLITGFTSGYYMYFRSVMNDLALGKLKNYSDAYATAVFFFVREYCYGSMFRYNAKGEFNIPYGGMSYNRKDMASKLEAIFSEEAQRILQGADIHCKDFEEFLAVLQLSEDDFIFLDPPYDTDFSDYDGRSFTAEDQKRLAEFLKTTPAKFMLVIKKTDFVYDLYAEDFNVLSFDKQYTYNICNRNDREVKHLIITNYKPQKEQMK